VRYCAGLRTDVPKMRPVVGRIECKIWNTLSTKVGEAGSLDSRSNCRCPPGLAIGTKNGSFRRYMFVGAADLRRSRRLVAVPALQTDVEHRDLADYDRVFDLDESTNSEGIA
jgi:hypothetical protein